MDLKPPVITLSATQLNEELVALGHSFLQGNIGEEAREHTSGTLHAFFGFISHTLETQQASIGSPDKETRQPSTQPNNPQGFSSSETIHAKNSVVKLFKLRSKIAPDVVSTSSTALSCLSSPEASLFIENNNKDVDYENKKVIQMSATEQIYTAEENKKASSGLGLITGMNMEGAITFKNFRIRFSTTALSYGVDHHAVPGGFSPAMNSRPR